jgi:hypothetical protein
LPPPVPEGIRDVDPDDDGAVSGFLSFSDDDDIADPILY